MAFIEPMHRNKPNITYLLDAVFCPKDQDLYKREEAVTDFFAIHFK